MGMRADEPPILIGSTLPIVQEMGGWVKRLYEDEVITRRRNVWDEEYESNR